MYIIYNIYKYISITVDGRNPAARKILHINWCRISSTVLDLYPVIVWEKNGNQVLRYVDIDKE